MISIIIPTLNEGGNIQICLLALQRLRNQSEIIIVDGGSVDDTIELSRPLVDKVIVSAKGRAKQMNAGAAQAKGKILVFLHADTFLPENALVLMSQANHGWGRFDIRLKGEAFMLRSENLITPETSTPVKRKDKQESGIIKSSLLSVVATFMNWRSRLTGIATGDQVIFVSKSLFGRVGGYSDIALMEDIDLCIKLKKISSPSCLGVKVVSSGRRWEQFGVFKTILLMWSLRLRYFFGENPDVLSELYSKGLFWKQ